MEAESPGTVVVILQLNFIAAILIDVKCEPLLLSLQAKLVSVEHWVRSAPVPNGVGQFSISAINCADGSEQVSTHMDQVI